MAIGAGEKVTTTGIMDQKPTVPQAPNLSSLGKVTQQATKAKKPAITPTQEPQAKDPVQELLKKYPGLKDLTAEDNATLDSVLSPSVKTAIGKIAPDLKPLFDQFGTNEPNVVIPLSVASKYAMMKYGGNTIDEAIQTFTTDLLAVSGVQQPMEQTTNVPPSPEPQGLMASPQTMEQV